MYIGTLISWFFGSNTQRRENIADIIYIYIYISFCYSNKSFSNVSIHRVCGGQVYKSLY